MKKVIWILALGFLLSGCGTASVQDELNHSRWFVKQGTSITTACLRFANVWSNLCQDETRNIRKGNYRVLVVSESHFLVFQNSKLITKKHSREAVNKLLGMSAVASTSTGSTDISFQIKNKKEQCAAIGFKPQTEKFADCVLRLVELDVKQQYSNQITVAQNSGNDALAKQLERQSNLQQSQFLMNLSQQLLTPSSPASTMTTCRWSGQFLNCW